MLITPQTIPTMPIVLLPESLHWIACLPKMIAKIPSTTLITGQKHDSTMLPIPSQSDFHAES